MPWELSVVSLFMSIGRKMLFLYLPDDEELKPDCSLIGEVKKYRSNVSVFVTEISGRGEGAGRDVVGETDSNGEVTLVGTPSSDFRVIRYSKSALIASSRSQVPEEGTPFGDLVVLLSPLRHPSEGQLIPRPVRRRLISSFVETLVLKTTQIWSLRKGSDVQIWNVLSLLFLDLILGSLAVHVFAGNIEKVGTAGEFVVSNLERLLAWITSGVPAGLKLNAPLNSAVGSFFLYHIYLWRTYIMIVQPFASVVLNTVVIMARLGLSVQLSILRDVTGLLTFHVYCFYVYAARLFNLQMSALWSLWRLFRGKKRNPLRQRVDSAAYDVDQLFVGTVLFTVLLFLLPTILVYYCVFTALRLAFLALDAVLARISSLLNSLPVFSILLWIFNNPSGCCDYYLSMDLRLSTVRRFPSLQFDFNVNFKEILHCLVTGKILYPI